MPAAARASSRDWRISLSVVAELLVVVEELLVVEEEVVELELVDELLVEDEEDEDVVELEEVSELVEDVVVELDDVAVELVVSDEVVDSCRVEPRSWLTVTEEPRPDDVRSKVSSVALETEDATLSNETSLELLVLRRRADTLEAARLAALLAC